MNRRNVLGNRVEESNTLWVILTGMLVTAVQFIIYHFVNGGWLGILLSALCILVGSAVVQAITREQEELLGYLLIPCVFSGVLGLLLPYAEIPFFPESTTMLFGCLFAWLVPVVFGMVYTWVMGNTEAVSFARFYKRAAIFFYMVYFGLVIYATFFQHNTASKEIQVQMIPFATFAAFVDGVMKETVSIGRVVEFVINRVVFFLPYGFFIGMVCRKLHGILRIILLLLLPVLMELIQLIFRWGTCDIDDIIFRFLGSLFGLLGFLVFDSLFQHFTARHFDGSEVDRDYYGRKI